MKNPPTDLLPSEPILEEEPRVPTVVLQLLMMSEADFDRLLEQYQLILPSAPSVCSSPAILTHFEEASCTIDDSEVSKDQPDKKCQAKFKRKHASDYSPEELPIVREYWRERSYRYRTKEKTKKSDTQQMHQATAEKNKLLRIELKVVADERKNLIENVREIYKSNPTLRIS